MKIVAVTMFKGGTGKTTTSVNVARGLAKFGPKGTRVLGLDLDRTQASFCSFGDHLGGVEVRATTAGRVAGYAARDSHDYAVVDCPPAVSREAVMALKVADVALVPVVPEMLVIEQLTAFLQVLEALKASGENPNLQVRMIRTMLDTRDKIAQDIVHELPDVFGDVVWPEIIARHPIVNAANGAHESLLDHAPRSEAARVYSAIARFVLSSVPAHEQTATALV